jgi:hypothetical protein
LAVSVNCSAPSAAVDLGGVGAVTAFHEVGAVARVPDHEVVAGLAEHLVVAGAAGQRIVAVATEQQVIARATQQGVVACTAQQLLVARSAGDGVVAGPAVEHDAHGAGLHGTGVDGVVAVAAADRQHVVTAPLSAPLTIVCAAKPRTVAELPLATTWIWSLPPFR